MIDKEKINKITDFLESCWDENQEADDGLSFEERVKLRMEDLPCDEKAILEEALSWS